MSCMPHRWYYVYTKITPTPITVYHSNYRKQIFFSLFCNEKPNISMYLYLIYIYTYIHGRYKYIEIIYKYIDTCKWLWLFQLWDSSSFEPFFFIFVDFWSGCEGSPNVSFNIRRQEAVLRKAVLWRGSNVVKMQRWRDNKRVLFPYRSPTGGELRSFKLPKKNKTPKRNKEPSENWNQVKIFSPLLSLIWTVFFFFTFVTCLKPEAQIKSVECLWWWQGCHCAPGMRREGNQSNQSNRRPPQAEEVARAEGRSYPGGMWRGRRDGKLSKPTCADEEKGKREATLAEHS